MANKKLAMASNRGVDDNILSTIIAGVVKDGFEMAGSIHCDMCFRKMEATWIVKDDDVDDGDSVSPFLWL